MTGEFSGINLGGGMVDVSVEADLHRFAGGFFGGLSDDLSDRGVRRSCFS